MVEIPVWEKANLTIEEAAALTQVGQKKIRELIKERDCDFALSIGTKTVIKRERFLRYLDNKSVI